MADMQEAYRHRAAPTIFLEKTYNMVDNEHNNNVISWTEDGAGFMIKDRVEFERNLLPKYFEHCKLNSFVRQLNYYGFSRRVQSAEFWEFRQELFKKGEKHQLLEIQRRAASRVKAAKEEKAVMSLPSDVSALNSTLDPEAVLEYNRLKRENAALKHELCTYKNMFHHFAGLLKAFADVEPVSAVPPESSSRGVDEGLGEARGSDVN